MPYVQIMNIVICPLGPRTRGGCLTCEEVVSWGRLISGGQLITVQPYPFLVH